MRESKIRVTHIFSNIGYIIGCVLLFIIAIWIMGAAVHSITQDVMASNFTVYNLLDEVALLVFAIAVIDVAKYLMLEEVIHRKKEKDPEEARRSLTKFAIIIATALSLEGLVLTIEVAKSEVDKILYPVSLLVTGTFMIIGIGIYQKLNASAEKKKRR